MFREFQTSYGIVRGHIEGDVVRLSRLRYALPAYGARRFAKPYPLDRWDGVLDATGPSAMAPQWPPRLASVMGDYAIEQSEDCLHLDIWIPSESNQELPVFVFLHGGAFIAGGGGMPCYDGSLLASQGNMIVVNVSYRLGALGLLPIPGVVPANLTLHDQIAALCFIREEIAAFGGDNRRITVAGQSAGALSIALLLAQPDSQDLFDQAIMLSAPLGSSLQTAEEAAETVAKPLLSSLGIDARDRKALCGVPVTLLLKAQREIMRLFAERTPPNILGMPFRPTIDNEIVHIRPTANEAGFCRPVIMGATSDEFNAFWYGVPGLLAFDEKLLAAQSAERSPAERKCPAAAAGSAATARSMLKLSTEATFLEPMLNILDRHAANGGIGFAYQFDWSPSGSPLGACHCIELPFLFGNLKTWKKAAMLAGAGDEELSSLRRDFQRAIISFVVNGDPATGSQVEWPGFERGGPLLHFGRSIEKSAGVSHADR